MKQKDRKAPSSTPQQPAQPTTPPVAAGDDVSARVSGFLERLQKRLLVLAWVAAGVIILSSVAYAMVSSRNQRVARGFAELSSAETVDALMEVAKTYSGTPCGEAASLALAQRFLLDGEYAKAVPRFSLFVQEYPQSQHRDRARLGEAYALEGDKKQVQAEKLFAALAAEAAARPDREMAAEAFVGAARCARQQGKLAEAKKRYQDAISTGAKESKYVTTAMEALKTIDVQPATPAVAAPPAAPAAAPAPAPAPKANAVPANPPPAPKQATVPPTPAPATPAKPAPPAPAGAAK